VLIVGITGSTKLRTPYGRPYITEMTAVLYRRSNKEGGSGMDIKAISFGSELTTETMAAIREHSKVPLDQYTGFGLNVREPCSQANMPEYQLVIPAADIWYGVTADDVHENHDLNIDLFSIRENLVLNGNAL
jgi:hypothetical protein